MKGIEVFVDANFARTWNINESDKMTSALCRTRYVIKIVNCPIIGISKMQTEVALSVTKAEYILLSQSTRDLIPLKNILEYLNIFIKINDREMSTFLQFSKIILECYSWRMSLNIDRVQNTFASNIIISVSS